MMNEYPFRELISMIRRQYKVDSDFTEYCVEMDCMTKVLRYGMFCNKHKKETV